MGIFPEQKGHGGATPRFWTPTTPPTNCWPEAPGGGGGGGGHWRGGFKEGQIWGGVGIGGAGGGLQEGRLGGGGGPGHSNWHNTAQNKLRTHFAP